MNRVFATWLLIFIVVGGIGLRSYHLTARSLWFDEAFSWRLIQFPVSEMIVRDATDVHPPLYYLALKGWAFIFGTSLLSLRSFSVFCAGLTIAAAYLLVSYGFKSRYAGFVAALLIAVSGFQIQYGWEARMYTLGTALALWSTYVLLKAIRTQHSESFGWWMLYAVSAALLAYTHYYAFFTLVGHAIFVAGFFLVQTRGRIGELIQSSSFWYAVISAFLAALLYLPWLPTFLSQNGQVQESYWIPDLGGWSVPDTFYRLFFPTTGIPPHDSIGGIMITILPMSLIVLGAIALLYLMKHRFSRYRDSAWLLVIGAFVPFVISIALSLFSGQSLYQDRYFVFAHLFILAGAAVLVTRFPYVWARRLLPTALILLLAWGTWHYWQELDLMSHPGAKAAVDDLYAHYQTNEPILVSSPYIYFSIRYYAEQEHSSDSPRLYSETGELGHFSGGPILTTADVQGPEIFAGTAKSLWIVDTTGFGGQPLAVSDSWRLNYSQTYSEVFSHQGDITINQYVR